MGSLRESFVEAQRDVYAGWRALTAELTPQDWDRPTGCPGWSVRDNLAHVIGIERHLLGDPLPDHQLPPGLDHVDSEFDRVIEIQIDVRRTVSVPDLVAELEATAQQRMAVLDALDDEGFVTEAIGPFGPATPKRTIPIRVFDMWAHEQDVRRATGRPGHLTGPAAVMALDRYERGLAHGLAQALAGEQGVLVLQVRGELTTTVAIDLADGQRVEPSASARATVTLDWADLVPLGCGRADAPDPQAVATVEGDVELGRRALRHLAFTP